MGSTKFSESLTASECHRVAEILPVQQRSADLSKILLLGEEIDRLLWLGEEAWQAVLRLGEEAWQAAVFTLDIIGQNFDNNSKIE
ncbi:hypothetical protein MTR_0125s0030 [Medicago truncatula]|uniref:Uncharacterized protein n=1 Tax=Medicago truncatula TaxID=3880 RepID=A0A072TSW7_MEDTR|nr:hypothetical protein MTR_0125s0030 [Medicago truncatula]